MVDRIILLKNKQINILLSGFLYSIFAVAQVSNVTISGVLKNFPDSFELSILIPSKGNNYMPITVTGNRFTFHTILTEPALAYFRTRVEKSRMKAASEEDSKRYLKLQQYPSFLFDNFPIFLEPGVIKLNANSFISAATVQGSQSHNDWVKYYCQVLPIEISLSQSSTVFLKKLKANDTTGRVAHNYENNLFVNRIKEIQTTFIQNNPDSYVSLYCLNQLSGIDPDYELIYPLYECLTERIKQAGKAKNIFKTLSVIQLGNPGSLLTEFTQTANDNSLFNLSSLRGKYVLIDFWASWCIPCREENPKLKKVWDMYNSRGFEIVSVSLDSSRTTWEKAIEKDGMTWHNVSDLKGWKNEIAKTYGITNIPQNILIDTNGYIIYRNISGDSLMKRLSNIFVQNKKETIK